MANMIDHKLPDNKGELKVWKVLHDFLSDDVVVYHNREVKGREFDFCLLLPNQGILILEVKGWNAKGIRVQDPDHIYLFEENKKIVGSPKKQSNMYKFSLMEKINNSFGKSPLVLSMVAYPFINLEEFYDTNLNVVSEIEYTLLEEDFSDKQRLIKKINKFFLDNHHIKYANFNNQLIYNVRSLFETNITMLPHQKVNVHYSDLMITDQELSERECQIFLEEYCKGEKKIIFTNNHITFDRLLDTYDHMLNNLNIKRIGLNLDLEYFNSDMISSKDTNHFRAFNFELMLVDNLNEKEIHIYDGKVGNCLEYLESLADKTQFNLEQYLLEHADDTKNIIVKAGAGTGKTYSMVSHIAYLCNKPDFPITNIAEEIAMVTFTNKAADQMKKRIKQMFTNYFVLTGELKYLRFIDDIDRARISTIHKFALEILREASYYTKLGSDFEISDNKYLRDRLYDKYLNEFFIEKSQENPEFYSSVKATSYNLRKSLIKLADRLITKNVDLESITITELGDPQIAAIPFINELFMNVIVKAEIEYMTQNRERNAISLNECIILLMKIMPNDIAAIRKLNIRYLFIDEFQDTDDVQIKFFKDFQKHIKTPLKLFVVGDLKQSIYRFRGAKLSAFDQLKDQDHDWVSYYLTTNYRSDHRLLEEYDIIFENMAKEKLLPYKDHDRLKGLKEFNGLGDHLLRKYSIDTKDNKVFYDELFEEIKRIQANIENNLDRLNSDESKIAILVRTNREVDQITNEARKRNIVVETDSSGHLFQFDATIDLYKLINALVRENDAISLINFLDSNYTNLNLNYERLHNLNYEDTTNEIVRIANEYLSETLGKSWADLLSEINTKPVLNVLREIFNKLKPWQNYSHSFTAQKKYIANYEYLIERIINSCRVDAITLIKVQHYLEINIATRQSEKERSSGEEKEMGKLVCMTVHKSKGLEFGTVILPFTDRSLSDERQTNIEANYSDHKLAYYLKVKRNKGKSLIEFNNFYQQSEELREQEEEESRILYVALTRAIYQCVWIEQPSNKARTWATLLEEEI